MTQADKIIAFIETLRVPDGAGVGQPFRLRDWQQDIIRQVYGPRTSAGRRIVRQAILSLGRKNGKTSIVAALSLAHLCGPEAVRNGQLYSIAYEREQASIVFKLMTAMTLMDEELSARLNIVESQKKIIDPISGSVFKALSSETKSKHGFSASFLAFDELAQFGQERSLYDVMMTSTGAHEDPLAWVFSTQAPSDLCVLSELVDYGERVNAGELVDPTFKSFFYHCPLNIDAWDEANWYLANPALGDFRNLAEMRDFADKAKSMPSMEASFRNLYLNQRIDGEAHFITPDLWRGCSDVPNYGALEWWGGLDLSSKNDLTALILVAQAPDGVYDIMPFFWAPGEGLRDKENRDRAPYCTWRDQGYLQTTPGRVIDYAWVAAKIGELQEDYQLAGIKFDRWRIDDLRRELDAAGVESWVYGIDWKEGDRGLAPDGLKLIPHGQGFKDMNPAVEILEDLLTEKKLRHGIHPVLTYCASNVRVQTDPAGNRKFDKLKSTGRIDGIVALAMALNGAVSIPVTEPSVYETRGVLTFQ